MNKMDSLHNLSGLFGVVLNLWIPFHAKGIMRL